MEHELQVQPFEAWHQHRPIRELVTCFEEAFRRDNRHEVLAQIKQEIHQGHHYIIASRGAQVVGFISWRPWFEPRHRLAELVHLGAIRHSGIADLGLRLVTYLEEQAHLWYRSHGYTGARKILLFTHADNRAAQRVYRRAGYGVVLGQDKLPVVLAEFTREHVDELMMIKEFPEHRLEQ